ncbi:hypothetical protein LTR74_013395 [Friedmanniomyces endolithicus]|nr:hypothetical protein LTR74_013395 [Friedmanniomyces endolithicus]
MALMLLDDDDDDDDVDDDDDDDDDGDVNCYLRERWRRAPGRPSTGSRTTTTGRNPGLSWEAEGRGSKWVAPLARLIEKASQTLNSVARLPWT